MTKDDEQTIYPKTFKQAIMNERQEAPLMFVQAYNGTSICSHRCLATCMIRRMDIGVSEIVSKGSMCKQWDHAE